MEYLKCNLISCIILYNNKNVRLVVPSFAHGEYFEKFAPYMKPGTIVATMPARSGGDILFSSKLGDKAKDIILLNSSHQNYIYDTSYLIQYIYIIF